MAFGCSFSDIVTLVQLTTGAYSNWKNACGEYTEITGELASLNVILKVLSTEATTPNGPLQRGSANYRDYSTLLNNSTAIVTQLNDVIVKFQNLGQSRRSNWNRLRFANRNLNEMRSKLTSHISLLSAFLDTINVSALGRIERDLRVFPEMMGTIHKLAAEMRAGKREGSVMTAYGDDDPGIWREFRRELIKEGYSSDSIRKYHKQLKGHLRALHADGLLDEDAPPPPCGSVGGSHIPPGPDEAVPRGRERLPLPSTPDEQIDGGLSAYMALRLERQSQIGAALHNSRLLPGATTADQLVPSAPFVAGIESEGAVRTQNGECTSTNDIDPHPTNGEPQSFREGSESSSGEDGEWFPTRDDAATFAQASHSIWPLTTDGSSVERASYSIWSSITDEGDSPESGDALSDSDTAVDDQAAEIRAVMSKLNEKRSSFIPHRTPPLPDGWLCFFDHERGLLYVDEWAAPGESKDFFLPPVAEKYPESPLPGGWRRVESSTGRIHWLHESGLVSNEHPGYSDCIRIGCISHDKCMRICGHFRNPSTSGVTGVSSEFELPRWEHVGNNSRVPYDNFQLSDTTLACQLTSTSWYQRPRPAPCTTIESVSANNDTLPPGWQKRHDFLGQIYFVHSGSNKRTSIDPGWSAGIGIAHNSELPPGWYQQYDERGQICFVQQSGAIESRHWVDPSWKLQWKTFFAHRKLESLSE